MHRTLKNVLIKWMKTTSSAFKNNKFMNCDMKPDGPSNYSKKPDTDKTDKPNTNKTNKPDNNKPKTNKPNTNQTNKHGTNKTNEPQETNELQETNEPQKTCINNEPHKKMIKKHK